MNREINILEELVALNADTLVTAERRNYYFLPEGYFNDLPSDIVGRIKVESIPVVNLYSIPPNYFETLAGLILDKIHVGSLVNSSAKELFSVPEDYFSKLSTNILLKIKNQNNSVHQELEEIAPLLNTISKNNVYSAPDGYFENLSPGIPKQISQPAKVISFGTKTRRWINYAAAACIAAFLFGGGYMYIHKTPSTGNNIIASTSNKNIESAISKLSDNEISNYLNNDKTDIYTQADDNQSQNIDVKMLLDNTSDQEIENYLLNNSDPDEKGEGI